MFSLTEYNNTYHIGTFGKDFYHFYINTLDFIKFLQLSNNLIAITLYFPKEKRF